MTIDWPLTDGRVTLRPATLDDVEALHGFLRLPQCQEHVGHVVTTLEEARAQVRDRLADPDAVIAVVEMGGEVVGRIGGRRYLPVTLGPEPTQHDFTIGYVVAPWVWGQGVATAAVRLLVDALHRQVGVRRVKGMVFADNAASIRVLQRCGFRLEGTERAAVLGRDGRWLDDCTLAHLDRVDAS